MREGIVEREARILRIIKRNGRSTPFETSVAMHGDGVSTSQKVAMCRSLARMALDGKLIRTVDGSRVAYEVPR